MENKIKNSICALVIISMIVLPFFGVTKNAEAQKYTGSAGYSGGYGNGGGGIQGYVKGLLPATLAMPQCVAIVKNKGKKALTSLFTFLQTNKYVSNTLHQVGNWGLGKVQKVVKKKGGNAAGEVVGLVSINPVPVHDEANNTEAKKQSDTLKEIARDNGTLVEAQTCYNAIGRAAAKLMLQAITVQTVNWINNGNDGKPLFLTDTKQFFNNMAKTQILQFGSEIKSPFGKAFLQAQANSLKTHFAQNAQYSLNDMIIHTTPYASDVKFSKSFSMGGWNAWNYLTQVPANNPLGFNMIASQELNKRLAGIDVSPGQQLRDDLNTAGGYLGVTRCADPKNLTKESSDINLKIGQQRRNDEYERYQDLLKAAGEDGPAVANTTREYKEISAATDDWIKHNTCQRTEYVTPGKTVAEKATTALGYSDKQLLKAEDLNDAIAAILDALLNKWATQIFTPGGLADYGTEGADGSFIVDNKNQRATTSSLDSQVDLDFPGSLKSEWLGLHPDFNIRTDLDQAMIDDQRTYINKLQDESSLVPNLVKNIYQLDYCIPGPHPGWEEDAQEYLSQKEVDIQYYPELRFLGFGFGGTDLNHNISALEKITGIKALYDVASDSFNVKVMAPSEQNTLLESILAKYIGAVHATYSFDVMPDMASEAATEYENISNYNDTIEENKDLMALIKRVLFRLNNIKDQVDTLNTKLKNGTLSPSEYEDQLKPWIRAFSKLSADLVGPEDISNLEGQLQDFKEKSRYVADDLLNGPAGCEAWTKKNSTLTPDYIKTRAPYPETIPHWKSYGNNSDFAPDSGFLTFGSYYDDHKDITKFTREEIESLKPYDIRTNGIVELPEGSYQQTITVFERFLGIY